jgi:hypothetical protein
MDPTSAALLAAALGVGGTLVGVLVRGAFDAELLQRQLAAMQTEATEQRGAAQRQIDAHIEVMQGQLAQQRREAQLARAEARAYAVLDLRRAAYAEIQAALVQLRDSVSNWLWQAQSLAKAWPDRCWNDTPRYVDGLGEEIDPGLWTVVQTGDGFEITMPGKVEHPAWTARRPSIEARSKVLSRRDIVVRAVDDADLICPAEVLDPVRGMLFSIPDDPGDSAEIEHYSSALWRAQREFWNAARADLASDITLGADKTAR